MNDTNGDQISVRELLALINNPLHLYVKLYKFVKKNHKRLTNEINNIASSREQLDALALVIGKSLVGKYSKKSNYQKSLNHILSENGTNIDTICLALFKALDHYLSTCKSGTLKHLRVLRLEEMIITVKPPNSIYNSIPDTRRVKEKVGDGCMKLWITFS